jgi:hypothetical protein
MSTIVFSVIPVLAELKITSISPDTAIIGQDLTVNVEGTGFDENTRAFLIPVLDDPVIGSLEIVGIYRGIDVYDDKAYLACEYNGVVVIDVSNPFAPKHIGNIQTPGIACDVKVVNSKIYVADWDSGLQIIDLSNLEIIGTVDTSNPAFNVSVYDNTAYVTCGNEINIVDLNSDTLQRVVKFNEETESFEIESIENILYISNIYRSNGFYSIDINDFSKPKTMHYYSLKGVITGISKNNTMAYVSFYNEGIQIFNTKIPDTPEYICMIESPKKIYDLAVKDGFIYGVESVNGLIIFPDIKEIQMNSVTDTNLTLTIKTPKLSGKYQLQIMNTQDDMDMDSVDLEFESSDMLYPIPDYTFPFGTSEIAIPFTINSNHPAIISQEYTIVACSNNENLVSNDNIFINYFDDQYSIQIKSFQNQTGKTKIAILASKDGKIFFDLDRFCLSFKSSIIEIEPVDINDCLSGKEQLITIKGNGFDKNTQAVLIPAESNFIIRDMNLQEPKRTIVQDHTAYICTDKGFQIIDVTNSFKPIIVGYTDNFCSELYISEQFAYVSTGKDVEIFDINNYYKPVRVNTYKSSQGDIRNIKMHDKIAYLLGLYIFEIVDFSDVLQPKMLGFVQSDAIQNDTVQNDIFIDVVVNKNFAYVLCLGSKIKIFDIQNKSKPLEISNVSLISRPYSIHLNNNVLYVLLTHKNNYEYIVCVDVSDPFQPKINKLLKLESCTQPYTKIEVNQNLAYVPFYGFFSQLSIIDFQNIEIPIVIAEYQGNKLAFSIDINNNSGYMTSENWFTIINIPKKLEITNRTQSSLTVKLPTPKYIDDYQIKLYNPDYSDSLTITYCPPSFSISNIPDVTIYPSIQNATFSISFTTTQNSDSQSYSFTGYSGIPTSIPHENITIEGTGTSRTMQIMLKKHKYGNIPVHVNVNDGNNTVMESFILTIKQPQFSYQWEELSNTTINSITQITDSNGFLYISNTSENCIQKYSNNELIAQWGETGTEYGSFNQPKGLAIDQDGFIYVADSGNQRIQVFTSYGEYVTSFGEYGNGQLYTPTCLSIDDKDTIHVYDAKNESVNAYQKKDFTEGITKALIVAGTEYVDDSTNIAIRTNADLAYRALRYQGVDKNLIYYLSADTDNIFVNDTATIASIGHAITQWATGESSFENDDAIKADSLIVYLVDHGGIGSFRVNESEILSATVLNQWLDKAQETIPGKLIFIYDACNSGSFIPHCSGIPQNRERIVITSTRPDETTKFVNNGAISFSNYFWGGIFNGKDVKKAFDLTQNVSKLKFNDVLIFSQHPQINVNGNHISNEPIDIKALQNVLIGNGKETFFGMPTIHDISSEQTITYSTSASITATGVWAKNGVSSVWAQIMPSDYTYTSTDKTLTNLPTVQLKPTEHENEYKGTYDGFTHEGTYLIAVYAKDDLGIVSYPSLTKVNVENPLKRKALIVTGTSTADAYTAMINNGNLALHALKTQAYFDDDIIVINEQSGSVDCLESYIDHCVESQVKDIVIYMTGDGSSTDFSLTSLEPLSKEIFNGLIDKIPDDIMVTVIYDAPYAKQFLEGLETDNENTRIFIGSTSSNDQYNWLDGSVSFSKYFWTMISNGSFVYNSYVTARMSLVYLFKRNQLPDILKGEERSKNYRIGCGIMFGDDFPIISTVSAKINPCNKKLTILANSVTTTKAIKQVVGFVFPPDFQTNDDIIMIELINISGSNHYSATYENCSMIGQYDISVCAIDRADNVSYPLTATVMQSYAITDLILSLRLLSGFDERSIDFERFDINHDRRFDLKDVIYRMKCLN